MKYDTTHSSSVCGSLGSWSSVNNRIPSRMILACSRPFFSSNFFLASHEIQGATHRSISMHDSDTRHATQDISFLTYMGRCPHASASFLGDAGLRQFEIVISPSATMLLDMVQYFCTSGWSNKCLTSWDVRNLNSALSCQISFIAFDGSILKTPSSPTNWSKVHVKSIRTPSHLPILIEHPRLQV